MSNDCIAFYRVDKCVRFQTTIHVFQYSVSGFSLRIYIWICNTLTNCNDLEKMPLLYVMCRLPLALLKTRTQRAPFNTLEVCGTSSRTVMS